MKAALALVLMTGPAQADLQVAGLQYDCDRGVQVPAVYVNDGERWAVTIHVEGQMVTLWQEESASGARYGWPSDGSSYVWWTKGIGATLYWKDGATGEETLILGNCTEAE